MTLSEIMESNPGVADIKSLWVPVFVGDLIAAMERDMPLTKKGAKIERAMDKEYGSKKGKEVFYASKNKGTIKGVEKKGAKR